MNKADPNSYTMLDVDCTCAELHKDHMCVLLGKGLNNKINSLKCTPNVVCEKCNQEANSEKSVCVPLQLFI